MKNKTPRPVVLSQPSESDIRDYAYELFARSGGAPGHDLDHWFEASAFLSANVPSHRTGAHHSPPIANASAR